MRTYVLATLSLAVSLAACSSSSSSPTAPGTDAGTDTGAVSNGDSGPDAGNEAGSRAEGGAGADGGADAGKESGASTDAGSKEGGSATDSGKDGGADAGKDSGLAACAPAKVFLSPPLLLPIATISPYDVAVGDVNKDGKDDLVTIASAGVTTVSLGNGDGTFGTANVLSNGGSQNVVLADLDGDGYADLVEFNQGQGNSDIVYAPNAGDGTNTFGNFTDVVDREGNLDSGIVADFNGDGKLDLAATGSYLTVALNAGGAMFGGAGTSYGDSSGAAWVSVYGDTGGSVGQIAAADVNGDGLADVLFASDASFETGISTDGGLCVSYNQNHGSSFADPVCFNATSGLNIFSMVVADLNGDGKPDVVVGGEDESPGSSGPTYNVFIGKGDGTFKAPVGYTTTDDLLASNLIAADVNNDGKLDLIGFYEFGGLDVSYGNGDGTFSTTSASYAAGNDQGTFEGIAAGVFSSDGLTGIAVVNNELTTANAPNGGIQILPGACSP